MRSGMPRNDLFFRPAAVNKVKKRIRSRFGAHEDSLVVLYAPTYRRNVTDPLALQIEFPYRRAAEALKERFPGLEPVFWERKHHQDINSYDAEAGVLDVSGYPDMQELLAAADILITDYSSSIWDFALLGRPAFLYVPDLAEYETVDRGFFTPIEEWPGILCRDDAELEDALRSLNEELSRQKAEKHLAAMGSCEDGHASQRVAELIHRTVFGGSAKL
jgi:CDP-glycerol glycerophosphotransferase